MPTVQANGIDINYEVPGDGEPIVLIPYLAADQACYAFQVAVDAFLRQSGAVLTHDAHQVLGSIQAPALITYGRHDLVCSTRFAGPLTEAIPQTELIVSEDCSHAPSYENVEEFNAKTLAFLRPHSG